MRITFDSNVWEFVVKPSRMSNNSNHGDFCAIHEALRTKRIEGFISETVGTLEAIKRTERNTYFNSIKPIVDVKPEIVKGNQVVLSVKIGTDHRQHPGLAPILQNGLEAASTSNTMPTNMMLSRPPNAVTIGERCLTR